MCPSLTHPAPRGKVGLDPVREAAAQGLCFPATWAPGRETKNMCEADGQRERERGKRPREKDRDRERRRF